MRVEGVDIDSPDLDPRIKKVFEGQVRKWGRPLGNHHIYARVPAIFEGAQSMWRGIAAARLLDPVLSALVNRRVAMLNGCVFWDDLNAAVSSELGASDEKILDLENYPTSQHYSDTERTALEYADAITLSDRDVDEELFARLRKHFDDDQIVELTMTIAWENSSSKFNRAFRVPAQGLWEHSKAKRARRK